MALMLRQLLTTAHPTEAISLDALETVIPRAMTSAVLTDLAAHEQRRRKLPARVVLLLTIALGLFPHDSVEQVLGRLLHGLRLLQLEAPPVPASKGALCQARYRLGVAPLVALFRRVCRPLATPQTPGAGLGGLRLVALDGTVEDVPDTPANARYFGRPRTDRGAGAFPQVRGVYLLECATHAIIDAGFWPCTVSETVGGRRLLRSVGAGMLLLWDRGFHSYRMVVATLAQGADCLGRLSASPSLPPVTILPDGSYTAWLYPHWDRHRRGQQRRLVRVLSYTLRDPGRPGKRQRERLLTSLLDPVAYPALDLICAYHERWEIELAIDELDTQQRLGQTPLRSQKPVGVLQELYGLLLAYYAVRATMYAAAAEVGLDPDRLSFRNAVRLICAALPDFQLTAPAQQPLLYQQLLRDIRRYCLPARANRVNPRVVKRKVGKFLRKRPEHRHPVQPTTSFRDAVHLLI